MITVDHRGTDKGLVNTDGVSLSAIGFHNADNYRSSRGDGWWHCRSCSMPASLENGVPYEGKLGRPIYADRIDRDGLQIALKLRSGAARKPDDGCFGNALRRRHPGHHR